MLPPTSSALRRAAFCTPSLLSRSTITAASAFVPRRSMARMCITGRLGADAEQRSTSTGTDIVTYSVGTRTHGSKDNPQTSWFRMTHFVGRNEGQDTFLANLKKGTLVYVEGDVSVKSYEDQEGKPRAAFNIVHRNIEILKSPSDNAAPAEATEGTSAAQS